MTQGSSKGEGGIENLPIVVAVRTALAGQSEGIFRQLPPEMYGATVAQAIDYALRPDDLVADEQPWARSLGEIRGRDKYSVGVNMQANVDTGRRVADLAIVSNLPLPRQDLAASEHLRYRFADIRLSEAQRGGLERMIK